MNSRDTSRHSAQASAIGANECNSFVGISDPAGLYSAPTLEDVLTYANDATAQTLLTLQDVLAANARIDRLPFTVSDVTVAPNVWAALLADVPVKVDGPSMFATRVHVDARLAPGTWHEGTPR